MFSVSDMISLVKSQQRELLRSDYDQKEDSLWKNSTRSDALYMQLLYDYQLKLTTIINMQSGNCFKHNKPLQFIGNDHRCVLNCRICIDCLRGTDNAHKKGVSNHETISIEQLAMHFQKLQKYSQDSIVQCNEAVQKYFRSFQTLLKDEMQKQKNRISKLVRKILLTGITKDDHQLDTILNLFNRDFSDVSCNQVGQISQLLFNFVPKTNHLGFKKFIEHISTKQGEIYNDFKQIIQTKIWHRTFLKTIETDISFPDFEEEPPLPSKASRVKTEQDSPKKTLRRSVKKQLKKIQFKDLSVQLKKPLQLYGSKLIQNREQSHFLGRLFDNKNIHSAHLLYRASQHNFSVKDFHQLCDGEPHTLVLAKTEFGKIIGGYTPIPWRSTANTLHSDVRCESFLFSLSLKQKMNLIDQKSAIFNSLNFGPTFGAGADLAICHNANVDKTSYSEFPYSYANSRYKENNQHSTTLFTGQKQGNHFHLKQWEVWKLNIE